MQASLERLRQRREEEGHEGGFTLIELLIVIVILAILAAIVVFAVQNLSGQSAKAACQSDYKTVETALEAYKAQTGTYPTTVAGIAALNKTTVSAGATVGPWLKDHMAIAGLNTGTASNGHYFFTYAATTASGGSYTLTVGSSGTAATGPDAAAACVNVT
jgi:general secretion pathway protein G